LVDGMNEHAESISLKQLMIYLTIAFTLSYLLDIPIIIGVLPKTYFGIIASIRMWMPFLATIIALKAGGARIIAGLKMIGWRLGKIKYIALGLAIPYILYGLGVLILYMMGYPPVNPLLVAVKLQGIHSATAALIRSAPNYYLALQLVSAAIAGLTINAFLALGEETGWRGLMYKALTPRIGLVLASITTGIIWGLWHADLIVYLGYSLPHHRDLIGIAVYVAFTASASFILYLLRHYSSSIIPPAVMHGTINALGSLMMLTYPELDEIYTLPVGIVSIISLMIIGVIVYYVLLGKKAMPQ